MEATADETAEAKRRQGVMNDVMQQLQHEQQQYLEAESRRLESIRQLRAQKSAVLERISHATKIHPGLHFEMSEHAMHSPSPGETRRVEKCPLSNRMSCDQLTTTGR